MVVDMATDFKIQGNLSTNRIANRVSSDEKKRKLEENGEGASLPEGNHQETQETDVHDAVAHVNHYVQNVRRDLQFSVDKQSGETIIKVVDSETNKVVRQIPPEEVIKLASALDQNNSRRGILFKDEV